MSNNGTSDQPESEYVPSLSSTPAPARQRTTTFAHFGKTASDYCTTSFATVTAPEPHRNDIANGTRRTLQELKWKVTAKLLALRNGLSDNGVRETVTVVKPPTRDEKARALEMEMESIRAEGRRKR